MKRIRSASVSLTLMACLGMLLPPAAMGANPVVAKRQEQRALDVSLHEGGLLVGQVVNTQGAAKDSVEVSLIHNGRELAKTKTDDKGRFAVKGVQNGTYTLATAGSQLPVRAWKGQTAPPSSAIGAMLVEGTAVRGQCGCNSGGSGGHIGHGVSHGVSHGGYSAGPAYSSGGYTSSGGYVDSGAYNSNGAASFNSGGASYNSGGAASYNQSGGAASFNQGGSQVVSGGTYDGAVTYGGDAGATYVDGSSGYYGGSTNGGVVSSGASYGNGVSYGSGYGASYGGASYGSGYSAGAGGGLFSGAGGGGGIFGGAGLLSNPWIIGAGVAAAIAIPIALDDDDAS